MRQILHNDKALKEFVAAKARGLEARHLPQKGIADAIREDMQADIRIRQGDHMPGDKDIVLGDMQRGQMDQSPYGDVPMGPDARQIWMEQWITAKIIGRWADGSSLARNPSVSRSLRNRARYHLCVLLQIPVPPRALSLSSATR